MQSKIKKRKLPAKALCILIAGIMFMTILVSCKNNDDTGSTMTTTANGTNTEITTTTNGTNTTPNYKGKEVIPVAYMEDFQGQDLRVLTRGSGLWMSDDILGLSSGSKVDIAVYNRNQKICSQYNFNIKETKDTNWTATATNLGKAQEDAYDMWSFRMNDLPALAQEGYILDLYDVEYINYDAYYYDQDLRIQGTFANRLFYLTGDLLYKDDEATAVTLFNMDIFTNNNLQDVYGKSLYQLVEDGEWTIEKFKRFASLVTTDNGDGIWDDKDVWGFNYQNMDILALNISAGNYLLEKDNNDLFVLNQSEKMVNDLMEIIDLLNSGYSYSKSWTTSLFHYNNQLFDFSHILGVSDVSKTTINFGVVPNPMINEDQQDYISFISTYCSNSITICSTVQNPNKIASMIELLSYESKFTVTPKLYEYLLEGRIIDHPEDRDMLEIILTRRTYELCYLWSTASLYDTMITLNNSNSKAIANVLASCVEQVEDSVARKLERLERFN